MTQNQDSLLEICMLFTGKILKTLKIFENLIDSIDFEGGWSEI